MESLQAIFAKRVRALREARGWSQERLGKAAKLGGKYVGVLERAEKAASFEAIQKLADALGVECYEFFVPIHRSTDAVQRHVQALIADKGRIGVAGVEEFLKALAVALRKLDRPA
jgi:transcriptional regulator with XRE-family HTH domain